MRAGARADGAAGEPAKAPCRRRSPSLKPRQQISGDDMAIIAIAVFLIVMAALNRFEFGRFD
jgi:hypothetical protein